ncbi:MAG: KH domain-containing protein [Thermovirgaceae bacterium]
MPDYEALVGFVVSHIVTKPEEVQITAQRTESGVVNLSVKTAPEDIGRVIGKHGATINAIRLIAKAAAVRPGDKVDVDILED